MIVVNLDFETRSTAELRRCGVYKYAECPDTDVWCMAYAANGGEPAVWVPGDPVPDVFIHGDEFHAWNAQFERVIYHAILVPRYGFPPIPLEKWYCTAAQGAAMSLPRNLGDAAKSLGLKMEKDAQGARLMLQMAKPRKPGKYEDPTVIRWWNDPEKLLRLIDYCKQDVRVEIAVGEKLRPLSAEERAIYLHDQQMNERGIRLDVGLVTAAQNMAAVGLKRANAEVRRLTDGQVSGVTKVKDLREHVETLGVKMPDLTKATVAEMLAGDIPDEARALLELRADAGRTSVTKLKAMQDAVCKDGRVRGLTLYHGASTGRDTGKLVQPHNFPRGEISDVEDYIGDVLAGDYDALSLFHSPLAVISSMLRPMLTATPGNRLLVGDYSAIEARVVNWLAGQDDVLDLFRQYDAGDKTKDPYVVNAMALYKLPFEMIEKFPHRQTGKFQELGCGFQMGPETAVEQAWEQYGLRITLEEAEVIVAAYRERHAQVRALWRELNDAAMNAVLSPGRVCEAAGGKLRLSVRGAFLWMRLPSGRLLCYAHPRVVDRPLPRKWWKNPDVPETRPGVRCMGLSSYSKKWEPVALYGGLLTENATQATARDILVEARLRLERTGYPVVLSVHDEIICDVPQGSGTLAGFMDMMRDVPPWAGDLPIAVEAWEGFRYKK